MNSESCQCWLCNLDDDERMEYEYSRYAVGCRQYNIKPLSIDDWFKYVAHNEAVNKGDSKTTLEG